MRVSKMKVVCVFSLESPHRCDSNEYTQHTLSISKRKSPKIIPNIIISAAMGFFYCCCCLGLKNEFEIAVVHEAPVFESVKFFCTFKLRKRLLYTSFTLKKDKDVF